MIVVKINKAQFEYDIHSLIKAFYPEQDVKVFVVGEKNLVSDPDQPEMMVDFKQDAICYSICGAPWEDAKKRPLLCQKSVDIDLDMPRVMIKNALKKVLYLGLCEVTGTTLPWGNLTGIRPTKIAMGLLEEGKSESEVYAYMRDTYFVSDEKAALSIDIARREKEILSKTHGTDGYSLYVGIPFCPTTCLYCSFTSYPICSFKGLVGDYLDAVIKELDYTRDAFDGKVLDTVYIGGGTPTTLEADELDILLGAIRERFDFATVQEFTVEAGRSDSITREKLEVLKKHGVTRISVNPQTMKDETLKLIGRRHSVAQVIDSYKLAREVGFTNINMDIILGLPEEDEQDVAYTMQEIEKLGPDSLTVHSLAIKRASRIHQYIEENGLSTLKNTDATMQLALASARRMGMEPYYLYRQKNMSGNFENVGYATKDNYGLYNILIMEEVQTIIACGAGTVTKRVYGDGRIERCDNVKDVGLYIEKIDEMIERKRTLFSDEN